MSDPRQQFSGMWRAVSQATVLPDGTTLPTRGGDPLGVIVYEPSGMMSVHLVRRERERGARLDALSTALDDYVGYFGSYTVSAAANNAGSGSVTHHVIACSYPGWSGTDQVRQYAFSDDAQRLTLSAAGTDGSRRIIVWERFE